VFGWRWLQWLGVLCYGLYVFNGPLGWLFGRYFPVNTLPAIGGSYLPAQTVILALAITVNIMIAWLSWHLYEKHFNAMRDWQLRPVNRRRVSDQNAAD
jgi:peptidoglycan/LPS O-acetylase OafA/YrhL